VVLLHLVDLVVRGVLLMSTGKEMVVVRVIR
jgi:hypothetical protein